MTKSRANLSRPAKKTLAPPERHHLDSRVDQIIAQQAPGSDEDALLDTDAVARWLGVSTKWLEMARSGGNNFGPPHVKVTARLVRYRRGDVLAYLRSRTNSAAMSGL